MVCSDKWVVQLVVDQCALHGITHWVFSPGSRNAPFALSVDNHPAMEATVIVDERSAAFFALGLAERTQKPVVLCCTSGSAPANYLPAITEAYYRNLPLLVVSADRPQAWIDQGDGQTIRQQDLFRSFTHSTVHLEDGPSTPDSEWMYQRETALLFAKMLEGGPAHINVGLSEPLYQSTEKSMELGREIVSYKNQDPSIETMAYLASLLREKKIMVLCGQMHPNPALLDALTTFSQAANVAVLTENTANLPHERFNACIDRTFNSIKKESESEYYPEVLITLGGAVVSKKIKSFLRKAPLVAHLKVGLEFPSMDTFQQLTHTVECNPVTFFNALNQQDLGLAVHNFMGLWKTIDYRTKDRVFQFDPGSVLSDFMVYQTLFNRLNEPLVLHMANSSVIRYCQLFDPLPSTEYYANRGTSGIDGSTSTAIGFASKDDRKNLLISGELSFLYDSNALQLKAHSNIKVLIINNQGGGIFRIIDGANTSPQRHTYLEASHQQNLSFAASLGWHYTAITESKNLEHAIDSLLAYPEAAILEVFTDAEHSPGTLKEFFTFVA
ncbi:MAG: 2-succinyl-5-enolpyruvyl-6-hydroxy-3-cyclohexene-1-carboxylic-acid synthase [Flavobacteriales bacterium]